MNILYIVHATMLSEGATKSFLNLIQGVVDRGITPYVLVPDGQGLTVVLQAMGVRNIVVKYNMDVYPKWRGVYWVMMFLPVLLTRRLRHFRALRYLHTVLKDIKIDLVHSNSSVVSLGYEFAKSRNIPHIYHIREYADKDFRMYYYPSSQTFHKTLHEVNSYSICITRDIQKHHGLTQESKSEVIYNGIVSQQEMFSFSKPDNYLLYAGRVEPSKGVLELLEAYNLYRKHTPNPFPLKIAGGEFNAQYSNRLRAFLKGNGIPMTQVIFLGNVTDIGLLMAKARAIIIPSRSEAFGRCMPEAMAVGCLVIGKNTGGTKEQFDNGVDYIGHEIGLRYETTDDLVNHLITITCQDNVAFYEMKQRAFDTVNHLYSNESYVNNVLKMYQQIYTTE